MGWKVKPGDATGFVGALNQSFQLKTVEGAVVSTWTPRSYVVQSDLSGGITGAQASIYTMAKTLVDQMLPLIDGLYPLDPAANLEDVAAVKDVVTSQLTNLCSEIGYLGGPRVIRVQQYLSMLLGVTVQVNIPAGSPPCVADLNPPPPALPDLQALVPARRWHGLVAPAIPHRSLTPTSSAEYWTDADRCLGSLGDLRDLLGLFSLPVHTRGAIARRHITSTRSRTSRTPRTFAFSSTTPIRFLTHGTTASNIFAGLQSQFLGTQLVFISRQLGVISEVVDEVRFVLDFVFIGPAQRETLQVGSAQSRFRRQLTPADLSL